MLILITSRCSMGVQPLHVRMQTGWRRYEFSVFQDAIQFSLERAYPLPIMLSGGEPTEHPDFLHFVDYAIEQVQKKGGTLMVMSNGDWLSQNTSFLKDISMRRLPRFSIQVVIDDRYYPKHVNTNVLRNYDCVRLCQDVQHIYPQGRALVNKLPYDAKASKCFNARAVVKQLDFVSYQDLVLRYSLPYQKYCSPNIDMHGNIRVGEIIDDIRNFSCHRCGFLNDKLDEKYKQFL